MKKQILKCPIRLRSKIATFVLSQTAILILIHPAYSHVVRFNSESKSISKIIEYGFSEELLEQRYASIEEFITYDCPEQTCNPNVIILNSVVEEEIEEEPAKVLRPARCDIPYYVSSNVEVKSALDKYSMTLGFIDKDTKLYVEERFEDSNLVKVKFNGRYGYIDSDVLAIEMSGSFTTTSKVTSSGKRYEQKIISPGVLTPSKGVNYGPSGKETYYNLPMDGVIRAMRNRGYTEEEYPYWIREDGAKMFGPYVMVAAELSSRPKGTILECSLGTAIVVDTGGFAKKNPTQLDIATDW